MNAYRFAALGIMACASVLSLAACSAGLMTVSPVAATSAAPGATHTSKGGGGPTPVGTHPSSGGGPSGVAGVPSPGSSGSTGGTANGGMNFQMITTSGTTKTIPVIAWGLFTAAGTDHENQGGIGSPIHTFAFPGGTFQLRYRFPWAIAEATPDPRTCLVIGTGSGPYTLSGGTGKYRRVSGSGHFTLNFVEIQAKVNGACSDSRPPVAFQEVITASGPASLP
jgi:hypothetical protein